MESCRLFYGDYFIVPPCKLTLFLFSSTYPLHLLSSVFCRICKRIKDGSKETMIPLDSNFIFDVYVYSVVVICFPGPVEIVEFHR